MSRYKHKKTNNDVKSKLLENKSTLTNTNDRLVRTILEKFDLWHEKTLRI